MFRFLVCLFVAAIATFVHAASYRNIVYFKEWGAYNAAGDFHVFDLDWNRITHVKYGFANPLEDGTVTMADAFAAVIRNYVDTSNATDVARGSFGLANSLKRLKRSTKFGLSIGGEQYSKNFTKLASTESGRLKFATSAVSLLQDLGLDFIDLHWAWPVGSGGDPLEMQYLILLVQAIRTELDKLPYAVELSAVAPGVYALYHHWDPFQVCNLLDHLHVYAFDFVRPRVFDHHDNNGQRRRMENTLSYTDHQANLYVDPSHPQLARGGVVHSVDRAIQYYVNGGCPASKVVMGIPSFGYSFDNTAGLYSSFTAPTNGSWIYQGRGKGVWDYKSLPQNGANEVYNSTIGVTYSYDPVKKTFISYDGPLSVAAKLDYIKSNNLGGTMFWSGDSDASAGTPRSLITQSYNAFGRANMAFESNNINYPLSKYVNIRENNPTTTPPSNACGGNRNVCYWPATHQVVVNWTQGDCLKHASVFVWCS